MQQVYYKSDFKFILSMQGVDLNGNPTPVPWPEHDFKLLLYTSGSSIFTAKQKDGVCTGCRRTDNGHIEVIMDNHHLHCGQLIAELHERIPDSSFPDGYRDEVSRGTLDIVLTAKDTGTAADSITATLALNTAVVSAYEIATAAGFQGSQEEFYAALANLGRTADIDALQANYENLTSAVADLSTRVNTIDSYNIPNVFENLEKAVPVFDKMFNDVEAHETAIETINNSLDSVNQRINAVESQADNNASSINALGSRITELENAPAPVTDAYTKEEADAKYATKTDTYTKTQSENKFATKTELAGVSGGSYTPSGDPMHYMYEAIGAVWNPTTGYWEMNTLTDLTNADMRKVVLFGNLNIKTKQPPINCRTAFCNINNTVTVDLSGFLSGTQHLEVLAFDNYYTVYCTGLNNFLSWTYGRMLKKVLGKLDLYSAGVIAKVTINCPELEDITLYRAWKNIGFPENNNLSDATLYHLVNNRYGTDPFVVTLHPTRYASLPQDLIDLATSKNISFASA